MSALAALAAAAPSIRVAKPRANQTETDDHFDFSRACGRLKKVCLGPDGAQCLYKSAQSLLLLLFRSRTEAEFRYTCPDGWVRTADLVGYVTLASGQKACARTVFRMLQTAEHANCIERRYGFARFKIVRKGAANSAFKTALHVVYKTPSLRTERVSRPNRRKNPTIVSCGAKKTPSKRGGAIANQTRVAGGRFGRIAPPPSAEQVPQAAAAQPAKKRNTFQTIPAFSDAPLIDLAQTAGMPDEYSCEDSDGGLSVREQIRLSLMEADGPDAVAGTQDDAAADDVDDAPIPGFQPDIGALEKYNVTAEQNEAMTDAQYRMLTLGLWHPSVTSAADKNGNDASGSVERSYFEHVLQPKCPDIRYCFFKAKQISAQEILSAIRICGMGDQPTQRSLARRIFGLAWSMQKQTDKSRELQNGQADVQGIGG